MHRARARRRVRRTQGRSRRRDRRRRGLTPGRAQSNGTFHVATERWCRSVPGAGLAEMTGEFMIENTDLLDGVAAEERFEVQTRGYNRRQVDRKSTRLNSS